MNPGKYPSRAAYLKAKAQKAGLRAAIAPLASWTKAPPGGWVDGYSVLIACHAPLVSMMPANFGLLARQDLAGLDRVVVALDGPATPDLVAFAERAKADFPTLRLDFHYQSAAQAKVLRAIGWGWVDCWLNYCTAIAACRTRTAMLHDMDALPLTDDFIAGRRAAFDQAAAGGAKYLGAKWYAGNAVTPADRLCHIVEVFLDVADLRGKFRPRHLFNRVGHLNGRAVEFDTMLYPQAKLPESARAVHPVGDDEWVHPSQVVSQYTYLRRSGDAPYAPPEWDNLFFVPYFQYLSGDVGPMARQTDILEAGSGNVAAYESGGRVDHKNLTPRHAEWIAKQVGSVERRVAGGTRPEVARYLDAIRPYGNPAGKPADEGRGEAPRPPVGEPVGASR